MRSRALWIAATVVLVAAALLILLIDRGADEAREQRAATPLPRSSEPRPTIDPIPASATSDAPAQMPEGLAQDLAMFNSDQLRAELESIALSYPAVAVLAVTCDAKPCSAEVQVVREAGDSDDEIEALDTFLDMVSKRFQGYVTAKFKYIVTNTGEDAIRVALIVGSDAPHPAPRVP